jgi:NMD protein affecting ribosome stability and mRNA decay
MSEERNGRTFSLSNGPQIFQAIGDRVEIRIENSPFDDNTDLIGLAFYMRTPEEAALTVQHLRTELAKDTPEARALRCLNSSENVTRFLRAALSPEQQNNRVFPFSGGSEMFRAVGTRVEVSTAADESGITGLAFDMGTPGQATFVVYHLRQEFARETPEARAFCTVSNSENAMRFLEAAMTLERFLTTKNV